MSWANSNRLLPGNNSIFYRRLRGLHFCCCCILSTYLQGRLQIFGYASGKKGCTTRAGVPAMHTWDTCCRPVGRATYPAALPESCHLPAVQAEAVPIVPLTAVVCRRRLLPCCRVDVLVMFVPAAATCYHHLAGRRGRAAACLLPAGAPPACCCCLRELPRPAGAPRGSVVVMSCHHLFLGCTVSVLLFVSAVFAAAACCACQGILVGRAAGLPACWLLGCRARAGRGWATARARARARWAMMMIEGDDVGRTRGRGRARGRG